MKVSALVCVHSTDHFHDLLLQRALESLTIQTYPEDFQVVVVLDECSETTKPIVEAYKNVLDIHIYERPRKLGLAFAKNFGISKCTGDWIAFLDADDKYHADKLKIQVDFILKNPGYDVVGTQAWDVYRVLTDAQEIKANCFSLKQYETDEAIKQRLPYENPLCHGSLMIRSEILKMVPYPTSKVFLGREDHTLWLTLAGMGYKFYNIAERLYYYSMSTSVAR